MAISPTRSCISFVSISTIMITPKKQTDRPIFIVGTSRSGTELMSQILNNHSNLGIAPETHYFDDLRLKLAGKEQQQLTTEEEQQCEDYFLALTDKDYGTGGDPEKGWMNRTELQELVRNSDGGCDAYFEAFCRLCAERKNKTTWGEKTPRHIYRIHDILNRYPQAKIICMVRHPGAVMASYRNFWKLSKHSDAERKRIKNSYNLLIMSLLWKASFKAALNAYSQFGEKRIYLQRFEDLISNPELAIKGLTSWLSLDYQASMHQKISLINSSFSNDKNDQGGFDKSSANRWRQQLSNVEVSSIQLLCGSLIQDAGYERETIVPAALGLTIWLWITLPFTTIQTLLSNRERIGNLPTYIWHRLKHLSFST